MNIVAIIVQLVSGAVGGNLAGALLKKFSLGPIWNSVVGILGGGIGGQILGLLGIGTATTGGQMDIASILTSIGAGGVGGGILMAIIGVIRNLMGPGTAPKAG